MLELHEKNGLPSLHEPHIAQSPQAKGEEYAGCHCRGAQAYHQPRMVLQRPLTGRGGRHCLLVAAHVLHDLFERNSFIPWLPPPPMYTTISTYRTDSRKETNSRNVLPQCHCNVTNIYTFFAFHENLAMVLLKCVDHEIFLFIGIDRILAEVIFLPSKR